MNDEYKRLLAEIKDAYFLIQDGKHIFASSGAVEHFGYTQEELIGKEFWSFIPPAEREHVRHLYEQRLAGNRNSVEQYESTFMAKDGSVVPIGVTSWVTNYQGRFAIAGIIKNISRRKKGNARLLEYQEKLKYYTNQVVRAQEEERKRLARELHDETIQKLLMINHRIHDIASGIYGQLPKPAEKKLADLKDIVEASINEVRGVIQDLRPDILDDMGLVPSIHWLMDKFSKAHQIVAEIEIHGNQRQLPSEIELTLFRIVQEVLNNIKKHARASKIKIDLSFNEGRVKLSIYDNGSGFNVPERENYFIKSGKFGLAGISERAKMLNGLYIIDSKPDKGTTITVEIPLESTNIAINQQIKPV
ncbi:MAG: PAS domain-containing sensor histidine kinase [Chloroflexi bacterium]|nr:PAS domain-containing sensor histidine kinase [Chloroflexota bacterium]